VLEDRGVAGVDTKLAHFLLDQLQLSTGKAIEFFDISRYGGKRISSRFFDGRPSHFSTSRQGYNSYKLPQRRARGFVVSRDNTGGERMDRGYIICLLIALVLSALGHHHGDDGKRVGRGFCRACLRSAFLVCRRSWDLSASDP
jgi:hypothetical protein